MSTRQSAARNPPHILMVTNERAGAGLFGSIERVPRGGMNRRRFARLRGLGFAGWAGIDAWLV